MKGFAIQAIPVRNLTTGKLCALHVAHIHAKTGQLLCECSEGLYYCRAEHGLTCPDCGTKYERIEEEEVAKTSKKKAGSKNEKGSEKLPRAIANGDLLTGEKVDFKKSNTSAIDKVPPKETEKKSDKKPSESKLKTSKEVRVVKQTRHLKVELSASEVDQRGRDAARIRRDIRSSEAELKSITSTFKARIATFEGQLDTALQEVEGRCTYRDVDCNEIHDFEEKIVRFVRLDTDVEIERREMTASELQLPLPKPKPPAADGTEKMRCHDKAPPPEKVPAETVQNLKDQAVERLNDDSDLTASELRARQRKQETLHEAVQEAEADKAPECPDPTNPKCACESCLKSGELDEDDDGIIDA